MDEFASDPDDELPDDEDSSDEYRRAAEATLQRLLLFLRTFNDEALAHTVPTDMDDPYLSPGAIYSIPGSLPDTFQVIKVLAVDEFGVHVRMYGNSFAHRPTTVAPALLDTSPFLSLAPEDAGQEWPLSVGHLPLLASTFAGMQAVYITRDDVTPDELEDYLDWRQAGGGYL
jgi:hypothetical protein